MAETDATLTPQDEQAILLAGARARGMADAFSLLGLPAVFLGPSGQVLHVGAQAAALFGSAIAVDDRRLVASGEGAAQLRDALHGALLHGAQGRAALGEGGSALVAHVIPVPASPGQFLRAIVLILDAAHTIGAEMAAAVTRLHPRDSGAFLSH